MLPVVLPPNRLVHFYLGGEAITRLRGVPAPAPRSPEEWLASTTARFGEGSAGLSRLPDGGLLRDAVAADPQGWTGGATAGGPGDVGVLVKLLDAGQRLPVHVHPDRAFAAARLHSCYGKTEAWYVLQAGDGAQVHLGWTEDVDPDELARAVRAEDGAWMLRRMHAVDVVAGDVVLVPAGTVHAIGADVFVVEVQEPTDFSLLLEFTGFATAADAFAGMDVTGAVAATDTTAMSPQRLRSLCRHLDPGSRSASPQRVLPQEADSFFRTDLLAPAAGTTDGTTDHDGAVVGAVVGAAVEVAVEVAAGFGVLVVLRGAGTLTCAGGEVPVARGDVLAVPHGAGGWRLGGDVSAVLCRPGLPT